MIALSISPLLKIEGFIHSFFRKDVSVKPTLLDDFRSGDEDVFNYFFSKHEALIFHYILKRVKDPERSRELTLEAFTKLWINRGSITTIDHLLHFLIRVARNLSFNYLTREIQYTDEVDDEMVGGTADFLTEQEILWYTQVRLEIVQEIFNNLKDKCYKTVLGKTLEGKNLDEIAKDLGLKKQSVKNIKTEIAKRISKEAINRLKRKLC